jgi:hypothetical protein
MCACVPPCAAVTFVALGNGAPDLSANIAAISAGEVTLSAGALTGAAMFVQVRQLTHQLAGLQDRVFLSLAVLSVTAGLLMYM